MTDPTPPTAAGRVCGADFTPIPADHPVEWLRGKVVVELAFDKDDLPPIVIGSHYSLSAGGSPMTEPTRAMEAKPPTPPGQIIHELCLLVDLIHQHGSESSAWNAMPEWQRRRYEWAIQQAQDHGGGPQ